MLRKLRLVLSFCWEWLPLLAVVSGGLISSSANATSTAQLQLVTGSGVPATLIKTTAPKSYVVKKTDTVMGLAHRYLHQASYWPQLIGGSGIATTKLYPGDRLQLLTTADLTWLTITSAVELPIEKLEPSIRVMQNAELPPTALKKLAHLITRPTLMSPPEFEALPMVVSGGAAGNIMYTSGDLIYVKGLRGAQLGKQVAIFSKFRQIFDPDTQELLGFEVRYNGEAIITQIGAISSLELTDTVNYVSPLDRVLDAPAVQLPTLTPHRSKQVITGKVVALNDALTATAAGNTLIINRGSRDGVEAGLVFDVIEMRKVIDPTSNMDQSRSLSMPPTVIGEVLIYKVEAKLAFGLVTDSARPLWINSIVQSQQ